MIALAVIATSPQSNPDRIRFLATFTGVYGTETDGDLLNLAPTVAGQNAGGFTNPKNLALPELPLGYTEAPSVVAENLDGYYCQLTPLVATGETEGVENTIDPIDGFGLRMFAPGGAELTTGEDYPSEVLDGNIILEVLLPQNQ